MINNRSKQHRIRLLAIGILVLSLVGLSCSVTNSLFVDTEATNEAIQKTDEAKDRRATERAQEKTQNALNEQATQVAQQATQNAINAASTQAAAQLTQQAQQQNQGGSNFGSGQYTFYVVNQSSQTVCYLYMSPSSSSEWGDDLLGSSTLSSGQTFTISGVPANTYDLMAQDCSGNELATQFSVDVPANDTWTLSDTGSSGGTGYYLYIDNYSSYTICYLYISPTTSTEWGDDWLGSDTIAPNTSYYFWDVPANNYDMRAEDCNHNLIAQYNNFSFPTYDTWEIYNP